MSKFYISSNAGNPTQHRERHQLDFPSTVPVCEGVPSTSCALVPFILCDKITCLPCQPGLSSLSEHPPGCSSFLAAGFLTAHAFIRSV